MEVENVRRHSIVDFGRKRPLLVSQQELRGRAWVADDGTIGAVFYRDEIEALRADERVSFWRTDAPAAAMQCIRS